MYISVSVQNKQTKNARIFKLFFAVKPSGVKLHNHEPTISSADIAHKGQKISKAFFLETPMPKKRTKSIRQNSVLWRYIEQNFVKYFVRFLGFMTKCFWDFLTLSIAFPKWGQIIYEKCFSPHILYILQCFKSLIKLKITKVS